MDYIFIGAICIIGIIAGGSFAVGLFKDGEKGERILGIICFGLVAILFLFAINCFYLAARTFSYDSHCDTCICESCCNAREETAPDGFILVHVNGKPKSVNVDSITGIETKKDWDGYSVRLELQGTANNIYPDESYDEIVELINNTKVVKVVEL